MQKVKKGHFSFSQLPMPSAWPKGREQDQSVAGNAILILFQTLSDHIYQRSVGTEKSDITE